MLDAAQFGSALKDAGYNFFSGVPCSFLKAFINYAINSCEYVAAVNEGDAVATASGAYLGGRKSVVLMQNSGLGNAFSPLSSLNYIFRIPLLGFISLRGAPGLSDEPQHELMGEITTQTLDLLRIRWVFLDPEIELARRQLKEADRCISREKTFFFVVRKNTFEPMPLKEFPLRKRFNETLISHSKEDSFPAKHDALKIIAGLRDKRTVLLAPTGKIGRELYDIEDVPNHLYMVGSMGCISALGLGLALSRPEIPIIAIDGDGALLMRLGTLATNAHYRPNNLLHILLDNSCHDSTGGHATVSQNIDFAIVAAAAGYPAASYAHDLMELESLIRQWYKKPVLTFIHLRIAKGSSKNLSRPHIKPYQVKDRLIQFVAGLNVESNAEKKSDPKIKDDKGPTAD